MLWLHQTFGQTGVLPGGKSRPDAERDSEGFTDGKSLICEFNFRIADWRWIVKDDRHFGASYQHDSCV